MSNELPENIKDPYEQFEQYCRDNGLLAEQVIQHEAAHTVIGYYFGGEIRLVSIDPDRIQCRKGKGTAGIADIEYGSNYMAEAIGACAGEEWDKIKGFYDNLTPEQQNIVYGDDRFRVKEIAYMMVREARPDWQENDSIFIEKSEKTIELYRQEACRLLTLTEVSDCIEKVSYWLRILHTINNASFKNIIKKCHPEIFNH